ncbi:hypothetical protein ACNOYE_18100 [Nannocystaceae bacterium ST9]
MITMRDDPPQVVLLPERGLDPSEVGERLARATRARVRELIDLRDAVGRRSQREAGRGDRHWATVRCG